MAKFHVRARTVDLLGRQQIAGIPTAISELFKNSHDAYARNVEVDLYRDDGLFVIRDDGLGMTYEEFEERWLTIGTDSKLGEKGSLVLPPRDARQSERPILGEKGIGRLAIAIIGPQVLVLTRAKRNNKPADDITAAYINWAMFELPGIDLDEIQIPLDSYAADHLPNSRDIRLLVDNAADWLSTQSDKIDVAHIERIKNQMAEFDVNPREIDTYLGTPKLSGEGAGTHFFIKPADPILKDDIDGREGDKASRIEKHLLGFTNTMIPDAEQPPIIARFRDHPDEGRPIELIGDKAFFTPDEFREVDHRIVGRFDEYGQFRGEVGVYQFEPDPHVINWNEADGHPTLCGPFSFSFAVLQGQLRDSLVPPEEHARLIRKLNRIGGLYVYRDGVRVQPYGDSDYDWLDIERRRTLSAAYYYFSYRRMFGAIELSREKNYGLVEKAGREGFSENKAYRQFRSILINFFVQIAADFFREDGKFADEWQEKRIELNRNAKILKSRAKQASKKKSEFESKLNRFFKCVEDRSPETVAEQVVKQTEKSVESILSRSSPPAQKALALMRVEKKSREQLREQRSMLTVTRPRGVGLSRRLNNEWAAYQEQFERIDGEVLSTAESSIESAITRAAAQSRVPMRHLARITKAVESTADRAKKVTAKLKRDNEVVLGELTRNARETIRSSSRAVAKVVDEVLAELEHLENTSGQIRDVSERREEFENRIESVFRSERDRLESLRQHFRTMEAFWTEDEYSTLELTEAMEEELESLRNQRDADLALAQVGLVINTINHEFEKTVSGLRDGFRRFSSWANANPKLKELYSEMRASFDHLDGYLSLFTPLDRRLNRIETDIAGTDIHDFLSNLFESRLRRHKIKLASTPEFRQAVVRGFPSTFFPVFANLVDNSIFWLQSVRDRQRQISLDWKDGGLIVADNGPGVSSRDFKNIFELNFSRKPGGRGMGLYISRATLEKAGYTITVEPRKFGCGAAFIIAPIKLVEN
ncbi:MAG: ATP-binding protein [Albidovulum sp.]|nr:ATP-binding protein [Albidovulum sp.]